MTSTFATQFISGSPKAMCEHREEKVSCKRLMGDKKGLQRKEKYKRVFRGSIKIDREDKGGLCQHVYCEKEERAEAGSSGSARKAHWRSFACSCQKWATIIRCLKILFLSLGRRCFIQIWCAPYPNMK